MEKLCASAGLLTLISFNIRESIAATLMNDGKALLYVETNSQTAAVKLAFVGERALMNVMIFIFYGSMAAGRMMMLEPR